jgi:hypothetical protein
VWACHAGGIEVAAAGDSTSDSAMTLRPRRLLAVAYLIFIGFPSIATRADVQPATTPELADAKRALTATVTRHFDQLLRPDGSLRDLKGKTAEGQEAYAFYAAYELTGNEKYRRAGVTLANRVLQSMRATKLGVLAIKEKDKSDGETILGGGPPALGFYAARTAYVLHREGGRGEDLRYLAGVIDRFAWNEQGWWASTVDVHTGESKEPLSKPSIINKTASMAMAAVILGKYVSDLDPELSARLRRKADKCIYEQILPAQEADGFWHYSLGGNDPKEKDVFGYFMLTTNVLMDVQQFHEGYRTEKLDATVRRAQAFALRCLAPMTEPNNGSPNRERATRGTPMRYVMRDEVKRGFALARILIGGGHATEALPILRAALREFPVGNAGQDGAHAAEPSMLILASLPK